MKSSPFFQETRQKPKEDLIRRSPYPGALRRLLPQKPIPREFSLESQMAQQSSHQNQSTKKRNDNNDDNHDDNHDNININDLQWDLASFSPMQLCTLHSAATYAKQIHHCTPTSATAFERTTPRSCLSGYLLVPSPRL